MCSAISTLSDKTFDIHLYDLHDRVYCRTGRARYWADR